MLNNKWKTFYDKFRNRIELPYYPTKTIIKGKRHHHPNLQLQEEHLNKLKQVSERKNIPVHEALEEVIDFYLQNYTDPSQLIMTDERREQNPILRLRGLASISFQTKEKEAVHS